MTPPVVKLRADAARNRAKILATADELFARDGLSVSVDAIAARALVGIGTLYRHFPTKQALVAALVSERGARFAEYAQQLTAADDPGPALFALLAQMVEESARKRHLLETLGGPDGLHMSSGALDAVRKRFRGALSKLLARAQRAGSVRADVQAGDVSALVRGIVAASPAAASSRARQLAVVIDGLRSQEGRHSAATAAPRTPGRSSRRRGAAR